MNRGALEEENRLLKERVVFLEREILRLSSGRLFTLPRKQQRLGK